MLKTDGLPGSALARLRAHIESHGMPPGAALNADTVATRYAVNPDIAEAALQTLLADGLLQADIAGGYRVSTTTARFRRDLVARIGPVLIGMGQMAAAKASPADISAMRLARDRMDAAIAVLDSTARAQAYRDFITAWAAATGNAFYVAAAAMLLHETADMIDALTKIDLTIYTSDSEDGELRRLVDAVAAGNALMAAAAAGDHAVIISHRVDGLG